MSAERKKVTADYVLDLYAASKKATGKKKSELMKQIIYLSQHLNEYIKLK
jgi:hypothetical protein